MPDISCKNRKAEQRQISYKREEFQLFLLCYCRLWHVPTCFGIITEACTIFHDVIFNDKCKIEFESWTKNGIDFGQFDNNE